MSVQPEPAVNFWLNFDLCRLSDELTVDSIRIVKSMDTSYMYNYARQFPDVVTRQLERMM